MATGSGKTYTAITSIYRLLKHAEPTSARVACDLFYLLPEVGCWLGGLIGFFSLANLAKTDRALAGSRMKTLSAKAAKYGFGRLIDLARAEPVAVAKHGRPVVVVMAVEEYERLMVFETCHVDNRPCTTGKAE